MNIFYEFIFRSYFFFSFINPDLFLHILPPSHSQILFFFTFFITSVLPKSVQSKFNDALAAITEARLSAANENQSCTTPLEDDQLSIDIRTTAVDDTDCHRPVESLVKCPVEATNEVDDEDMKIIIFEEFVNNIASPKPRLEVCWQNKFYRHCRHIIFYFFLWVLMT